MTLTPKNTGWIEVICGSMFSGKTEELIRRLKRAEIAQMKVSIFRPALDNRYDADHIVSHNQMKMKSFQIEDPRKILKQAGDAQVVGIDEAQFFNGSILDVCKQLAGQDRRVVIAGLDKDFRGKSFGPMPDLMCEADYVSKLRAICVICGDPANFTQRLSEEKDQVLIGEKDHYEARCRNCFEPPKD